MKLFIILLLIIILGFLIFKKPMEQQQQNEREVAPRQKPVYIDPVTVYLNEPILYDEWPQAPCEISSSL